MFARFLWLFEDPAGAGDPVGGPPDPPAADPDPPAGPEPEPSSRDTNLQDENAGLRALLTALVADIDIDKALDEIAYKRDGTPVYIGEVSAPEAPEPKKATPSRRRPAQNRGGAPAKVPVSSMSDGDLLASIRKNGMKQFA